MSVPWCRLLLRAGARHRAGLAAFSLTAALLGATSCAGGSEPGTAAEETSRPPTSSDATEASDSTTTPSATAEATPSVSTFDGTVVEVGIASGEVQTADQRVIVPLNSMVRLLVSSDTAGEVHLHGVDQYVQLRPGETVTHDFTADVPGTFEVEIHDVGLLFSLQVQP